MHKLKRIAFAAFAALAAMASQLHAEDGYRLWLRYEPADETARAAYAARIGSIDCPDSSPTLAAAQSELQLGLAGLLGEGSRDGAPALLVGTPSSNPRIAALGLDAALAELGDEGYLLAEAEADGESHIVVAANGDIGALYGAFALLRHMQTAQPLDGLELASAPRVSRRMLNHWDNLTRTTERVMVASSIWNWFDLPYYVEPRVIDYARAMASVGLNGTVLTNVNANATVLRPQYLEKVAALADAMRPYGVQVYLTARYSAPIEIDGYETADPLDPRVRQWWADKAAEIYRHVPDFGGFLVKADSEGQPGPRDYGRNHAEGANMLADAVAPHGGVIIWRAFVYEAKEGVDRHRQAFDDFVPLDGQFRDNVSIQIKNGAIDFMPREPFHPLFGNTPKTAQAIELQIAQEYMGGDVHMAFLAPMWKETLDSDTYVQGPGSTVASVIDGSLQDHDLTVIAGVSNIGNERSWTGHPMAAANWYAFGRLAWDHGLSSRQIADEWTRMTFSNTPATLEPIVAMLMGSHETVVSYSMPLGIHHIMYPGHHYGPGPWYANAGRADWTSVYYHQADEEGIGFDRTAEGSNALGQYAPEIIEAWGTPERIPEKLLLWFHHVDWDFEMDSGRALWDEICLTYQRGVEEVGQWRETWDGLASKVDAERHRHVAALLHRQHDDAMFWRDACLSYFQTFSQRPIPDGVPEPAHDLEYYKSFELYHVPGHPGEHWRPRAE